MQGARSASARPGGLSSTVCKRPLISVHVRITYVCNRVQKPLCTSLLCTHAHKGRAVGSNIPLVRRVIALGRPIIENVRGARKAREARPLGGLG